MLSEQATTLEAPPKQAIGPTYISATSYDEVVAYCDRWISEKQATSGTEATSPETRYICVTSAHGVVLSSTDPVVRNDINAAALAVPDGMPLVWALRSFGFARQARVYGPSLMLALCRNAAAQAHRIFLYGASESTLQLLRTKMLERFGNLRIAGVFSPPYRALTETEDEEIVRMITDSQSDLVFVGLSTPKQERWMATH